MIFNGIFVLVQDHGDASQISVMMLFWLATGVTASFVFCSVKLEQEALGGLSINVKSRSNELERYNGFQLVNFPM